LRNKKQEGRVGKYPTVSKAPGRKELEMDSGKKGDIRGGFCFS